MVFEGHSHNNVAGVDRAHSEIIRGMVVVGFFVLVGKLASAAKEMIVAWRFGVGAEVDAYLFLFNIVNWPVSLWFGVLAAVLVPVIANFSKYQPEERARFQAEILGKTLLFSIVFSLFSAVVIYVLLQLSWTGLSAPSIRAAQRMVLPLALISSLGTLIALFSVWLLANGRHINTLLESVPALVICFSIILFGSQGIDALVWGTLAGFACHAICLAIPLKSDLHKPLLSSKAPQWTAFWTGFSTMLAGQAVMSITGLIDQFFVAHLAEGALSTLTYAQRILSLILGLCSTAVGRAMIPFFARSASEDRNRVRRLTLQWVTSVLLVTSMGVAFFWWLAPMIVQLLFERGAFTAYDTAAVVEVFRPGLLQIPFNVATVILFYALAGRGKYGALTIMATIAVVVKIVANITLISDFGTRGIMIGSACMSAALMFMYLIVLNTRNGWKE